MSGEGLIVIYVKKFSRGYLSHKQYFESVVNNASNLDEVMPKTCSDMRVTQMPPTSQMLKKAANYLQRGGVVITSGTTLVLPSATISNLSSHASSAAHEATLHATVDSVLAGFQADFSLVDTMCKEAPASLHSATRLLGLFESLHLSMHVVTPAGCSCVAFNDLSVCWHWALKTLAQSSPLDLCCSD